MPIEARHQHSKHKAANADDELDEEEEFDDEADDGRGLSTEQVST